MSECKKHKPKMMVETCPQCLLSIVNEHEAYEKRIKELEAALVKFGNHKYDCGLSVIERCNIPEIIELGEQKFECPRICDCGLEQALKG